MGDQNSRRARRRSRGKCKGFWKLYPSFWEYGNVEPIKGGYTLYVDTGRPLPIVDSGTSDIVWSTGKPNIILYT